MNEKPEELTLLKREPEPSEPEAPAPAPLEIDAAESRWDPWLLALARIQADEEARRN